MCVKFYARSNLSQELLRSAGVGNWIQSIGWLIHATAPHLITVSLITIFFCGIVDEEDGISVLGYSDGTLVWMFQFLSVVYSAAFFYLLCSLFQKRKLICKYFVLFLTRPI